jgi:MFS family permease
VLFTAFTAQQRRRQDREPLVPFALFRSRNYTAMNAVSAAISVGVLGLMLLLSLYFQNVLHFSALKAGLALAPASVVSMLLAPFAGRLTDKVDGKYVLLTGMLLTAVGMLWNALAMGPHTAWAAFVAPMIVVGAGNGCLIAPMAAVAMRGVEPAVAGAASGVLNTVRQLGSVVGSAAVGALVQTQTAGGHDGVSAMRTSMALPIAVIVLGAVACATVRREEAAPARETPPAAAEATTSPGSAPS